MHQNNNLFFINSAELMTRSIVVKVDHKRASYLLNSCGCFALKGSALILRDYF